MPLDFTAIDFETANSSNASACSVGLVKVRDGRVVDRAGWFIRPPFGHDHFNPWNTRIHGIVETDVAGASTWCEQLPDLIAYVHGDLLVAHNAGFDMGVIRGGCTASLVDVPAFSYLCSLVIARRIYHLDSYRLPVAAMAAGFEDFAHHDALADAEACAAIVIHAGKRHGAADVAHLAKITGAQLRPIGAAAVAMSRPRALSDAALANAALSDTALSDAASSDAALSDAALSDLIGRSGAMGASGDVSRSHERRGRIA